MPHWLTSVRERTTMGLLQNRLGAFAYYCAAHQIVPVCGLVEANRHDMDTLAAAWSREYQKRLAVIAYDDEHALRFMTAMHKLGLPAPTDFRVIDNNDTDGSRYSDPPLTTVAQNFDFITACLLKAPLHLHCENTNYQPEKSKNFRSLYDAHVAVVKKSLKNKSGSSTQSPPSIQKTKGIKDLKRTS